MSSFGSNHWDWFLNIAMVRAFGAAVSLTLAFSTNCAIGFATDSWAIAQISPDTTLPNNSIVTPNGSTLNITGGTQAGGNLFHSFQQFSIPTGGNAFFNNAADIQNIISRVTGKSISNIDGLIRASGTANLFFLNPNGIVFGQNARLDFGGSFVASTANAVKLANGDIFSANPVEPLPTQLLNINPNALLFNQIAAQGKAIVNRSQAGNTGLKVQEAKSLLLVGGDIFNEGGWLQAPGGRVELVGLSGAGTVGLNISDRNFSLNFPVNAALGSVSLTDSADVNVASSGGGSIAVNARNIDVLGGSSLRAGISLNYRADAAQAGDITLKATGTLNIENSSIYNAAFGAGNGGNLFIDTGKLIIRDGIVTTATVSGGRAGDLIVKAKDSVELTSSNTSVLTKIPVNIFGVSDFPVRLPIGLFSTSFDAKNIPDIQKNILILTGIPNLEISLPTAGGNAGNLTIETGRLIVRDGAVISAGTTTAGNAGNLTVKADFIDLSGTSANQAPPGFEFLNILGKVSSGLINGTTDSGSGASGKLFIETGQLIVRDGARLATTTVGTTGGELIVNAESVELSGTSANGFPSLLTSATRGSGDASPLTMNTKRLSVSNGAIISAGTTASGNGGELTINATEFVKLIGTSSTTNLSADDLQSVLGVLTAAVFTEGSIPSGVITGTFREGNALNLTINTGRLLIQGGAQASVSSVGTGNAGSLIVNASSIELSGTSIDRPDPNEIVGRSLLTTAVGSNSTGRGGNIDITTNTLSVVRGAAISVSNAGREDAGSLKIAANSIKLDTQGRLAGTTALGNGGNITLNIADLLLMRHNSQISTTAGTALAGGNGGNINIDAPSGFIVARASENSDITANAFSGSGGKVTINATGIFGMTVRSREDLVKLLGTNLNPQLLTTNDITAISQTSPTLNGTVTVNTPDVDPNRGLVNLPTVPVDTSVAQGCTAGGSQAQSKFVITGRGGLPPNPGEALSTDAVQVDLVTLKPEVTQPSIAVSTKPIKSAPVPIVEATGWVKDANGNVVLTANASTVTPHNSWQKTADCRGFNPQQQ